MFNARGGFPGQRPMAPPRMNQPGMNHLGMNMSGMNMGGMGMSSMNQPGMNLSGMNQPNMNLSGMNQPGMNQPNMNLSGMNQPSMNQPGMNQPNMNTGMTRMGHPGMNTNVGLSNVNQPVMNTYRMGPTGMNQGGMGFQSEIKGQGYGMRPMDSPGSFHGGSSEPMGMKGMPMRPPERHMAPQAPPPHFPPSGSPMTPAPPRMIMQNQEIPSIVNRVVQHSSDPFRVNPKQSLQEPPHPMEKKPMNPFMYGNSSQDMGMKPGPSPSMEQMPNPNPQNRYTNESASSILESFGLSNEDLEELSRYPDDQLTPVNLPNILKDIRLRKINRSGGSHDQGGGGRRQGDVLPSKVIDYGHSSKYPFSDNPAPFESSRTGQKPPPKRSLAPASGNKNGKGKIAMDNKIPTISSSRTPTWQASMSNRPNNKTLVGEQAIPKIGDTSVTVLKKDSPVITIKPDSSAHSDIPVITDTVTTSTSNMASESPIETVVSQVSYPPPAEATTPTGKGKWVPPMSQDEAQKMKRMPTPSMMNDYFAASPRIFPHICSLCNLECRHVKDWIKHQNNTSHIESCRKLRQQYPDWNPQVHTLSRNDAKKDETTAKSSRSKSGSPRRAGRSKSRSGVRRSRSPRSGRRSKSRSPRRARHSPKHSRSPLRSPRKGNRSPRRSPFRRRGRSSTPPDKKAVDAAVLSFVEASKLKPAERPASRSDGNKVTSSSENSNVKGRKPVSTSNASKGASNAAKKSSSTTSSSSSKKPGGSSSSVKSVSSSNGSASRSAPKKPLPSTKKPVVSTGAKKTAASTAPSKRPQPSKPSHAQRGPKQPAPEPYNPLNKFTSTSSSDKIIHVTNLPDTGYTDQDLLKMVRPFGKVCDILIVRSKNEAFLETNFKEAAAAAVKFSETVPVMINGKRAVLSLAGQHKEQPRKETKSTSDAESAKSSFHKAPPAKDEKGEKSLKEDKAGQDEKTHKEEKGNKKAEVPKHDIEVPPGFVKCHRLADPPLKDADKCIVVISNLPEKQYTVEEVSNLARPFGGVNDILIISNYRKAYLELPSKNSVDSMLKFYSVFPTCLYGSTLSISMAPGYKNLKDENRIFAEILEQASFKITPTIYEKFVHLSNLPNKEIQEFELTRLALRFGKVEHYVLMSNKRKAIFHMQSPAVANSMHNFLSRFPARIRDFVLRCTLVSKPKLSEDEYITYLEEQKSSEPEVHEVPPTPEEAVQPTPEEAVQPEAEQPASDIADTDDKGAGTYSNVEVEDDDDDEEAAEAAEAPETPSCFIQPEAVEEKKPVYSEVPQSYVTEDSDVLVSVESDEEYPDEANAIPVMDCDSIDLLAADDSDEDNDMETSNANDTVIQCPKPADNSSAVDDQNAVVPDQKAEEAVNEVRVEVSQTPDTTIEPPGGGKESEDPSVVIKPSAKGETSPARAEESSDKDSKSESGRSPRDARNKRSEDTANALDDKSRQKRGRSRQSSHGKTTDEPVPASEESKDAEQAANKSPVTRTAKFNPQKGELCVTLTVDSQKSSSKISDSKKRVTGDKGPSAKENSTPKSISNRSSPSESASGNPKSSSGSHQTKSGHRGASSQDREAKVSANRSRDNDSRSNRKDDRSKDSNSSSSRHMRSSTRSTRGQRTKEEGADTFPFNLEEFVTVDEILEDHTDSTKEEKDEGKSAVVISTPKRGGKRKETHPPASDAKKAKEASGDTQELSFVTLDEIGDEEENTTTPESPKDEAVPSSMKEDEVHTEDKVIAVEEPTPNTQEQSVLMTLDEVSDDEEPNPSAMPSGSATIPDKDQLLTLDEISGEDEEQTSHSGPIDPDQWLTYKTENKEGVPERKENPQVADVLPQELDEENPTEQPLLTLDEVHADDEEDDSLADMEHHFLTVDEVGEEEEDSVVKEEEEVEEPRPKSASKARPTKRKTSPKLTQPETKTTPGRRGRPRKRPLCDTPADKDTSQPTSAGPAAASETKPKCKAAKGAEQAEADNITSTPDRSGTPKTSETPAKKTKLETPSSEAAKKKLEKPSSEAAKKKLETPSSETAKQAKLETPEKAKLAPFNSSVPVGLEFLVPKTGYFCELCSLFYMDDSSKIKHCKSLRHYQAVQKYFAKEEKMEEEKSPST